MFCPTCRLPRADAALDRECPFCSQVFSRVDAARRHAKRCSRRGDRELPAGTRGRKPLACDECSRLKVHCNARDQHPCERCTARELPCTSERYCSCGDGAGDMATPVPRESPHRSRHGGVVPMSFLLSSTDDTQDFVTERAVGTEPDGALLGPIQVELPQARAVIDEIALDYIDPTLLLSSSSPAGLVLDGPGFFASNSEEDLLSSLLTSRSHGEWLASRIELLEAQVAAHAQTHNHRFDAPAFRRFLSVSNVYSFATTFCRKRHYRYPIIHWPTFALEDVSPPLLLVVALTGATYSYRPGQDEAVNSARSLYLLADSFAFEQLSIGLDRGVDIEEAIQLCQAALLMYGLDTLLAGNAEMQHTAITRRLPALVFALRRLNLMGCRHVSGEDWRSFLVRESIIRVVSWTFCADCLATLSSNHPPLFSMLEMTGDLACDPELWDTDSALAFEMLKSSRQQRPSYPLKDLLSNFLTHDERQIELESLPLFHLHVVLCGLQQIIFNLHVTMALPSQAAKLLQILATWRRLWKEAIEKMSKSHRAWLGVARYVPGIEYLSRRVIEVAVSPEASNSRYLRRIPSNGTRELHEFIRDFVAQ